MHPGQPHRLDEVGGLLKLRLGLAGEARDDVGGDGAVGHVSAQGVHGGAVFLRGVAAAHAFKHRGRPGLQRQVELPHDPRQLGQCPGKCLRDDHRLQRPQPHPVHPRRVVDGADGVQQGVAGAAAIAGQVDARDHQLAIPGRRQPRRLRPHRVQRHGAHRAAHGGDDAVGAVAVAALLDLHGGAGLALVAGHEQALEARAFQRGHGADLRILQQGLLQQRHHLAPALDPHHQAHAVHGQDALRVPLGQTAAHHDGALRLLPGHPADGL